jgi:hypothetical protein
MVAGSDETDVAGSRGPAAASETAISELFDIVKNARAALPLLRLLRWVEAAKLRLAI